MWELQNHKNTVNSSLDAGRYEEAIEALTRWRELVPVFEPLLRARLAIYRRLENREAFNHLAKILSTGFPENPIWQAALAEARRAKQIAKEAGILAQQRLAGQSIVKFPIR